MTTYGNQRPHTWPCRSPLQMLCRPFVLSFLRHGLDLFASLCRQKYGHPTEAKTIFWRLREASEGYIAARLQGLEHASVVYLAVGLKRYGSVTGAKNVFLRSSYGIFREFHIPPFLDEFCVHRIVYYALLVAHILVSGSKYCILHASSCDHAHSGK